MAGYIRGRGKRWGRTLAQDWRFFVRRDADGTRGILTDPDLGPQLGGQIGPLLDLAWPIGGRAPVPLAEEEARLDQLDGAILERVTAAGGLYLGRVTGAGWRQVLVSDRRGDAGLAGQLAALVTAAGFEPRLERRSGATVECWLGLQPTAADLRSEADLALIADLRRAGDPLTAVRPIEHRLLMPDGSAARACRDWLQSAGYEITGERRVELALRFLIQARHHGTPDPSAITPHSQALDAAARGFGGIYDGWTAAPSLPDRAAQ